MLYFRPLTGADPDLQIRVGGGGGRAGHPDPEIEGGSDKKFFSAPRASIWSKNKGGPGPPRAPSLDPPLLKSFFHYK